MRQRHEDVMLHVLFFHIPITLIIPGEIVSAAVAMLQIGLIRM